MKNRRLKLSDLRNRLSEERGQRYWKSLEELAETEEFQHFLHDEFPSRASEWLDPVGRRRFIKLMAASFALAGLGACTRQPEEKILPYVTAPEEIVPGKPLFYATAFTLGGYSTGVLVESHMGRPVKVEGNPDHPASLGATDIFAQASVLTLYDPNRSQVLLRAGQISTWNAFLQELQGQMKVQELKQGSGLRILTESVNSPTLAHQIEQLLSAYPQAQWHQYEPAWGNGPGDGAQLAFGEYMQAQYRFDRADVIVALDADFVTNEPGHLRYARDFMRQRHAEHEKAHMNRLYAIESSPTNTGSVADHHFTLAPGRIVQFAFSLAEKLGLDLPANFDALAEPWIDALVRDLQKHRGRSLIIPGSHQTAEVHALAHLINDALGNVGETVVYTDPVQARPGNHIESLRELVEDMAAGRVEMLIIIGGNPAFTAPVDLEFGKHLSNVPFRAHLSLYDDETSRLCHWHIPATHYLETWSDGRAFDGTASIIQPLIAPLYAGRSAHDLMAALRQQTDRSGHQIVQDYWRDQRGQEEFDRFWQTALHDGVIPDTAFAPRQVQVRSEITSDLSFPSRGSDSAGSTLEVLFRPDPTIYDGQFANNGWLQELPKPLTKLTWDNAALISPSTAQELGLSNEEVVELRYEGHSVRAPIWIQPGQPHGCVILHLGYGRTHSGHVGTGLGFNAYALRLSTSPWLGSGLEITSTGGYYPLASTQDHHSMEGRHLIRTATAEQFAANPHLVHELGHEPQTELSMYPEYRSEDYAWGMAINLNACIGCNACVLACQAENNIPIVGKSEVSRGREMHWIRVDRYYEGNLDNPRTYFQPVPCMHCEKAPCEPVCPVAATVHSGEGLNEMVYNRCVGTRYCSNNCPYKVRRFNFLIYSDYQTPSLKLLSNPDVTVRSRGVMEKCTYCVQRINAARIEAEKEDRQIQDGEIQTACQQVCPTEAIAFGNINDPQSRVSKMKAHPLNYGLLAELNTRPRTTYWANLKNPNPEIQEERDESK